MHTGKSHSLFLLDSFLTSYLVLALSLLLNTGIQQDQSLFTTIFSRATIIYLTTRPFKKRATTFATIELKTIQTFA